MGDKTGQTKKLLNVLNANGCCIYCPPISPDPDNAIECRENGLYAANTGGGGGGNVGAGVINRLAYYPATGSSVDDLAAITPNLALISDANGLPIASAVTALELSRLAGVSSSVQGQLNAKQPTITVGTVGQYFRGDLSLATFPNVTNAISALTPASVNNSIDNTFFTQTWKWDSLGNGTGLLISGASTLLSGTSKLVSISLGAGGGIISGVAVYPLFIAGSAQNDNGTVYGIYAQATNSSFVSPVSIGGDFLANGGLGTKIGIRAAATNAGNNYAIIVPVNSGTVGFGTSTPTALLHLAAGAAGAGKAQLKLDDSVLLTTPENGAIEKTSTHLYVTLGGVRYQLDQQAASTSLSVSTKTGNYTILVTNDVILVDATGGNITITLPTAVGIVKPFTVKRIDGSVNNVNVATTASQTIDGSATLALLSQYDAATFVSNNANWFII